MAPNMAQIPVGSYHDKQWRQQQQHQGDTSGAPRTQWRARSRDDTRGTGSSSSFMGQQHQQQTQKQQQRSFNVQRTQEKRRETAANIAPMTLTDARRQQHWDEPH
eukprot:9491580-Pyramimonas_sp.AAC.1